MSALTYPQLAKQADVNGNLIYPTVTRIPVNGYTEILGFGNSSFLDIAIVPKGTPTADGEFQIRYNADSSFVTPASYGTIPAQTGVIQVDFDRNFLGQWRIRNTFGVEIEVTYAWNCIG